ncbi:hypothetical protein NHU_02997 [Rhodovulum sulfidophilum]|uniref:Uncharacterized protein n=1 Tax=Rhodovulum sulfidophilum TaxID=35806 RepID=A0A0D6B4X8_RHOSU|nr:hypothetical protein NHU_02997 [Rhodovulum sulfidophilum]
MSQTSRHSRMPAFSNSAAPDETRALIRARIESLLSSRAVASQVGRQLRTKGCCSPWAAASAAADEQDGQAHEAAQACTTRTGRQGWRSNSSRQGSH